MPGEVFSAAEATAAAWDQVMRPALSASTVSGNFASISAVDEMRDATRLDLWPATRSTPAPSRPLSPSELMALTTRASREAAALSTPRSSATRSTSSGRDMPTGLMEPRWRMADGSMSEV